MFVTGRPISDRASGDHINSYLLPTDLSQADFVVHRIPFSDRSRGIRRKIRKETWTNIRELGRGGFGVVRLQQEQRTKQLRAVKEVSHLSASLIDPLRELVAMAELAKVRLP